MKLHSDQLEGVNVINAADSQSVSVNKQRYTHSVIVPYVGDVAAWPVDTPHDLNENHFKTIVASAPEVVIVGTGAKQKFLHPSLLRTLMEARIGVEFMDTIAACRTYNVLAGEGRKVVAALVVTTSE